MSIPKITHQIWMQGFENIPEKFKKNVSDLHKLNPEYEHKQWDEQSLRNECLKYSKECLERFDAFDLMIMKVDLGRYVVLYNYGGISVDTDMVQINSINKTPGINSESFIISRLSFPLGLIGYLNNAILCTSVHNKLMQTMINEIIQDKRKCSDFLLKEICVDTITGPKFITRVLKNTNTPNLILDNKYFEPCPGLDLTCKADKNTIMDHKHEASWASSYLLYIGMVFIFIIKHIVYIVLIFGFIYAYKNNRDIMSFIKKRYRKNK